MYNTPMELKNQGHGDAADKSGASIQDTFLNAARKDRSFVTIYLVSGVKLTGRIRSFDKYALVLESGNQEQLIYKHAISTVVNQRMQLAHAAQATGAAATTPPSGVQASGAQASGAQASGAQEA